eukprot:TRINITY_DN6161_c0_g3_i10.p1 TRINITY_DN6161_c0_g3~~TRINITY_DN6161_c0_g3_i10.p1  ORF type:complete len:132 (-),score=23.90 TRINITY_DN6161_c0_g3_i10:277-672(-)
MSGYGALLCPSLFSSEPDSISNHIQNYLEIARCFRNRWIDILRHIAWMLKRHPNGKQLKILIFQSNSLPMLLSLLLQSDPPTVVTLSPVPPDFVDKIEYPKEIAQMSAKEFKKNLRLLEKKKKNKTEPSTL